MQIRIKRDILIFTFLSKKPDIELVDKSISHRNLSS
jgi:hypothetical protein